MSSRALHKTGSRRGGRREAKKPTPRTPATIAALAEAIPRGATLRRLKINCGRCPKLHGPYWYAAWWSEGKTRTRYIGSDDRLGAFLRARTGNTSQTARALERLKGARENEDYALDDNSLERETADYVAQIDDAFADELAATRARRARSAASRSGSSSSTRTSTPATTTKTAALTIRRKGGWLAEMHALADRELTRIDWTNIKNGGANGRTARGQRYEIRRAVAPAIRPTKPGGAWKRKAGFGAWSYSWECTKGSHAGGRPFASMDQAKARCEEHARSHQR